MRFMSDIEDNFIVEPYPHLMCTELLCLRITSIL